MRGVRDFAPRRLVLRARPRRARRPRARPPRPAVALGRPRPASSCGCGRRVSRGASSSSPERSPSVGRDLLLGSASSRTVLELRLARPRRSTSLGSRASVSGRSSAAFFARRARGRLLGLALEGDRIRPPPRRRRAASRTPSRRARARSAPWPSCRRASRRRRRRRRAVELADGGRGVVQAELDELELDLGAFRDRGLGLEVLELALREHREVVGVRAVLRRRRRSASSTAPRSR